MTPPIPTPARPRRRRTAAAVAGLLAATLAAGACSSGDSSGPSTYDPKAQVTITWWTGQTAEAQATLDGLAAEYTKLHPNVKIKSSAGASTTDELLTKLSAGFTADTYPDISYAYGSWATQLAQSGRTQDIAKAVTAPAVGWGEIPEAARRTATVDGKVIGVPALVDNLGLLYNRKLFDAAGVAYPTDDWTWEDFRAAAKKLTDRSRNVYGTAYSVSGSEDTTWHLWPLLWQRGGTILDEAGEKPTFNSAAGVDALTFLRDMAVEDKSMYLDQTDEKYGDLFEDGRIGMIISGPWELYDLATKKTPYGTAFLPGTNGDHQTISGPDLWVLLDRDDANRAGAARDFILWLTSKEQDVRWNLASGNLPLRASERDTPEFASYVKDYPGGQKFFDNLENAKQARPTVPGYVEMSRYVGQAVSKVLQGAEEPKAALDEAAKKSRGALSE